MDSNFGVGDYITINAPTHVEWHGRKGTIKRLSSTGFITEVVKTDGTTELVDLFASQMIKVVKDPGLAKLLGETLPGLVQSAREEHEAQQEQTVAQANHDIRVYKTGVAEGYFKGYQLGYVEGYQAAIEDVQKIFAQNGLPFTGDDNANPRPN